jgi:hypothetical protein
MKAVVQIVGDYDEESNTYSVCLLADQVEVDDIDLADGDEVELTIVRKGA